MDLQLKIFYDSGKKTAEELNARERATYDEQIALLASWPVDFKDGKILLRPIHNGKKFQDIVADPEPVYTYIKQSNTMAMSLRQEMAAKEAQGARVDSPEIIMADPNGLQNLGQKLEWHALRAGLESAGAKITVVTPPTGKDARESANISYYTMWTRDRIIAGPESFIYPSETRHGSNHDQQAEYTLPFRKAGQAALWQALRERPEPAEDLISKRHEKARPYNAFLEGDDVIQDPVHKKVFVGYDPTKRSEDHARGAGEALAKKLGMDLFLVPRVKSKPYYHLDTMMAVLPDGGIVLAPEATTPEVRKKIHEIAGPNNVLELDPLKGPEFSLEEGRKAGIRANLITINGKVFTGHRTPQLEEFIKSRGYEMVPMDFQLQDSGPRCQTAPTPRKEPFPSGKTHLTALDPKDGNTHDLASLLLDANFSPPLLDKKAAQGMHLENQNVPMPSVAIALLPTEKSSGLG